MIPTSSDDKSKALEYLKSTAPFSVIDRGLQAASQGQVSDCSRIENKIIGSVHEDESTTQNVSFTVQSARELEVTCSCCTPEDLQDQWCYHAVALFSRAHELGFFDERGGFAAQEATYRMNTGSPEEIANVITELTKSDDHSSHEKNYRPRVGIRIETSMDRLGVQVSFDDEIQTPAIFEGMKHVSARALDNVLIQILEEQGNWDEPNGRWYVNSSKGIETIIGLIQEYSEVRSFTTSDAADHSIVFSHDPVDAKLVVEWHDASVELVMSWILPSGNVVPKTSELIGTGPYWTIIDNVFYRISASGSRIASVFPYSSTISLPRSQAAPILEVMAGNQNLGKFVEVLNPELQPDTSIEAPVPTLRLEKREQTSEHFGAREQVEIQGTLDFEYPTPPANKNLVYLPDRIKEREYIEVLRGLGFEYQATKRRYCVLGDAALDLLSKGTKPFAAEWKIDGFEAIRKSMRFVDLVFNVSMASATQRAKAAKTNTNDWFDCQVSLVQNNANVPISSLFKHSHPEEDRWIRLDSGAYAQVPGGSLQQLKTTFGMLDPNFRLCNTLKSRLSTAQALSFTMLDGPQFNVALDPRLSKIARKLEDFSSITKLKPSKSFKGDLRPYQEDGLSWLNFLYEMDLGGILADEMGLGKTVQTLALLQHLRENPADPKEKPCPTLVVAPTSVITNWLYEAKRFAPKLKVLLLHGTQRRKLFEEIPEHDLVITSYALLRLDRSELEKYQFGHVILDEAQNIKNPETATTRAAKGIRSKQRLALTGTPTENRPMELWSIMDFLMPGYLGSFDFFRQFIEKPIMEVGPDIQVARFLLSKTKPFILRRKKNEVEKDLPPKTESVLYVPMTESQRQLYSRILEEVRPKVFDAINQKGVGGASISILAALLRLRQVCNHPQSIESLREVSGFDSGKFNALKELVTEAVESGRKILLFSQFRDMLAIIRGWLEETKVNYLYLDGATKNRQDLIDQFNGDQNVRLFLISLKAGGTGLNLTAADTVIIYDPWWNPAVESQAVDRAHRIGQNKPVSVYRLVTEDSVEKKIMELKAKKARMVDALINNESGLSVVNLSKGDLENLFSPFPIDAA